MRTQKSIIWTNPSEDWGEKNKTKQETDSTDSQSRRNARLMEVTATCQSKATATIQWCAGVRTMLRVLEADLKCNAEREKLKEDAAEAPDVGLIPVWLAFEYFR